jgi:hypothetical protein
MSNLVEHAKKEFEILGWPGDNEMQQMMCDNLIELLQVFSDQGHSGFSGNYCLSYFGKLARFDSISPLTGKDEEWQEIAEGEYQNKRDSSVFKKNGQAYWIYGRIFRDADGCCFTSKGSRVGIEFPWIKPEPEIVDVEE